MKDIDAITNYLKKKAAKELALPPTRYGSS
jgi:hypothetical protein